MVFVGMHFGLMIGLFREWRRDRGLTVAFKNTDISGKETSANPVSVLVPIRNEESRMAGLLESLAQQDYPEAEFIFIDDGSTDKSPRLLKDFAAAHPAVRIITLGENPGPNRKQYALARGIETARGNLLLFTDADCEVPPRWISAMVARMADSAIALTIGPVFKRPDPAAAGQSRSIGRSFFRQYQCFDHAIRYMYLAGSTGLGAAGGGFGNNLILRREALDRVGGYEKVPPSPTEDAALVSLIRGTAAGKDGAGMGVHAACGSDLWVMTRGERTWKAMVNQTLRWNNGGLFSPDLTTRFNFGFLMVTISMGILAIPVLPLIPGLWPLSAAVLFSMAMNTIATLGLFGPALPGWTALPGGGLSYIVQIVFTPSYFTFLTILGFCGVKADWKGAHYKRAKYR
jgi:cellulose synthase/poly-beta-1,6-N-acetylglucosamine synthase-like glycosyltransferase